MNYHYFASMKTLYLIRHAKSSWEYQHLSDFERPLNDRGKRTAPEMAERLKAKNIKFDYIISSTAVRAGSTAVLFATVLGYDPELIDFTAEAYEASEGDICSLIQKVGTSGNHLAVFGHNPTTTFLASRLCGKYFSNVPTAGIVAIEFDIDNWNDLLKSEGRLLFFDYPKNKQ